MRGTWQTTRTQNDSTRPNRELLGLRTEYRIKPGERFRENKAGEPGLPSVQFPGFDWSLLEPWTDSERVRRAG